MACLYLCEIPFSDFWTLHMISMKHDTWAHLCPSLYHMNCCNQHGELSMACGVFFYSFCYSGWSETESNWYCGHNWPIVPAPDDRWGWLWSNWWNEDGQRKPEYSEKTYPSTTLSTTNSTWPEPDSNPVRLNGKPATNRLSYGADWYSRSVVTTVPSRLSLTPLRIIKNRLSYDADWYNRSVVTTVPSGLSLTPLRIIKNRLSYDADWYNRSVVTTVPSRLSLTPLIIIKNRLS
jgi:hypothetical protein